jgi:alpha-ketoglutarate-dependent 2,4-dichlorophenoxyacetate dioxygenase
MSGSIEYSIHEIDGALGAEVTGFDAEAPLDDARFGPLKQAILARQVLVLRDCPLTPEAQIALSRRFGPLPPHYQSGYHDRAHPEIFVITNLDKDGRRIPHNPDPTSSVWHIDGSWGRPRTSFTMLHGIEVPAAGGDTEFANTYLAYDSLPPARRAWLDGLTAVHDLAWSVTSTNPGYQWPEAERNKAPVTERPVVVPHTETGRKAIYLGQHAAAIKGMDWDEGRRVIAEINAEASRPEFCYAHRWRAHDVVIWDNRCTMHRSTPYDYASERRLVHRTSMQDAA